MCYSGRSDYFSVMCNSVCSICCPHPTSVCAAAALQTSGPHHRRRQKRLQNRTQTHSQRTHTRSSLCPSQTLSLTSSPPPITPGKNQMFSVISSVLHTSPLGKNSKMFPTTAKRPSGKRRSAVHLAHLPVHMMT